MDEAILGARIRELRRQIGLTQADMARRLGISASYLNLIERNKRRIGGALLRRTAEQLGVSVEDLDGASERRLVETLREIAHMPALADQQIEVTAAGELIGRYPGWARALAALARSEQSAQNRASVLADRMTHDPFLGEAVHRMLTRAAAIRSAAEIMVAYDDIPAAQLDRFHRIINDEAQALTEVGEALAAYFDKAESEDAVLTPQDEVEALFEASANRFPEIEARAADLHGLIEMRSGIPAWVAAHAIAREHLADSIGRLIAKAPMVKTAAASSRAEAALTDYAAAAILMPLPAFAETAAAARYDVESLAAAHAIGTDAIFRRLTALPEGAEVPRFGYLSANAAGTLTEMLSVEGLTIPRLAGACPLWILYRAQQTPETLLRQRVVFPSGQRFIFVARARSTSEPGFGKPRHFATDMLVLSEPDAAHTVYAPHPGIAVEEVGPACRLCPRETCRHRVTDPLTG